ncbi:hypothetical protein ACVR1G_07900 [Streptococcus dentasini]
MTRQCNDLMSSPIDACLAGSLLTVSLLFWKLTPSLMPVILMTASSLLLLGLAELYFLWKDRQLS